MRKRWWTIPELRDVVKEWLQPGHPPMRCWMCRKRVHSDKRKLDSIMARTLCKLFTRDRAHPGAFHDYRRLMEAGRVGECSSLQYWELVERDVLRPGYYRITEKGRAFIRRELTVPRAVWVYMRQVRHVSKRQTDIDQALGDKYVLEEMIAAELD